MPIKLALAKLYSRPRVRNSSRTPPHPVPWPERSAGPERGAHLEASPHGKAHIGSDRNRKVYAWPTCPGPSANHGPIDAATWPGWPPPAPAGHGCPPAGDAARPPPSLRSKEDAAQPAGQSLHPQLAAGHGHGRLLHGVVVHGFQIQLAAVLQHDIQA